MRRTVALWLGRRPQLPLCARRKGLCCKGKWRPIDGSGVSQRLPIEGERRQNMYADLRDRRKAFWRVPDRDRSGAGGRVIADSE
jgi:hypothetical protein